MIKQVYIVHARNYQDTENQIVGVYTESIVANERLKNFRYGYVLTYLLNKDIPTDN